MQERSKRDLLAAQTFKFPLMPQASFPRLPSLPNELGILDALQQTAAFVCFPYSENGTNEGVVLADDLLIGSSFQCLVPKTITTPRTSDRSKDVPESDYGHSSIALERTASRRHHEMRQPSGVHACGKQKVNEQFLAPADI